MKLQKLIKNYIDGGPRLIASDGTPVKPIHVQKLFENLTRSLSLASPERPIGILLNFDANYFTSLLACLYIGKPFLPLRKSWPQARIEQIRNNFEINTIIDETFLNALVPSMGTEPCRPRSDIAYNICTSGTTGIPKGVLISRKSLEHFYDWMGANFGDFGPQSRLLFLTDFSFDISHVDIALALHTPLSLRFSNFSESLNLFELIAEIEEFQPNIINTVPNNFNLLCRREIRERVNFGCVQTLFSGGARFPLGLYQEIFQTFPQSRVFNFYGPTEATIYSHIARLKGKEPKEVHQGVVTIGKPIGSMGAFLHKNGLTIDTPFTEGELFLSGPQLMQGYYHDAAKTSKVLRQIDGRLGYSTGDIAYRDPQGQYYIIGRTDDTIKRRGYRVNLLDIDSYLQTLEGVSNCKTISVPDADAEHLLISYVVCTMEQEILIKNIKEILPQYQTPDRIIRVDELPVNNSGKVCTHRLLQLSQNLV